MSEQIDDYGPLPNQWAYGSERLNRMLKNIRTNSRKGGMIENTYANTFFRHQLLAHKVCYNTTILYIYRLLLVS